MPAAHSQYVGSMILNIAKTLKEIKIAKYPKSFMIRRRDIVSLYGVMTLYHIMIRCHDTVS